MSKTHKQIILEEDFCYFCRCIFFPVNEPTFHFEMEVQGVCLLKRASWGGEWGH